MKIDQDNLEGKYWYVRKFGSNIIRDKVKIKKVGDDKFRIRVSFSFGEKKYFVNGAEIASHIQQGDLIKR